jgi:DNA-binding NarL/FixJ family response regulator
MAMNEGSKLARVLLVDDHPALLQQVHRLLEKEYDIAAALADGSELLQEVDLRKPEVIVMDITLPGQSGLNLAFRLRESACVAKIVFLTAHCDADYARAAFAAGASAYVVKSRMASDLLPALQSVLNGKQFVSPCPELKEIG